MKEHNKTETDSDTEHKLVVASGERKGRRSKIGVDKRGR